MRFCLFCHSGRTHTHTLWTLPLPPPPPPGPAPARARAPRRARRAHTSDVGRGVLYYPLRRPRAGRGSLFPGRGAARRAARACHTQCWLGQRHFA